MIDAQYELLFDGRTLCVECAFLGAFEASGAKDLALKIRTAAKGPKLRLHLGTVEKREGGLTIKTFINTDESEWEVAKRFNRIKPKPALITVGIVEPEDAAKVWAEFHKLPHVQEGD
jgi:hypothetical protein